MDMNTSSSGVENAPDFPELPSYADGRGVRSGVDLRVLRYFLAVADEGNITWAAELLQISQPTLSRQLKGLEDALGVTLFHRGPHQISLTPEGRLLRERAQELVQLAGKMEREVRELHGSLSGTLQSVARRRTAWIGWPGVSRHSGNGTRKWSSRCAPAPLM